MKETMIEKISWEQARPLVQQLLPKFAEIIDALNPNKKKLYLYQVKYPYGAMIVDHGVFQIPNSQGEIVPLSHATIPAQIKEDLGYSGTVPMGLVTQRAIEAFMYVKDRVIPSSIVHAGHLISLWRVFEKGVSYHTGRFWNITSGARSICMAPKITDSASHKALARQFHLQCEAPQSLFEQWKFFTQLANHSQFPTPWTSTVLFFPKHWLNQEDSCWADFNRYLLDTVWQSSSFRRNQFIFDFAFSLAQEYRNLRPNPYLADTVRHLIALGSGAIPALSPAINDLAAPVSSLQQLYTNIYGLKKYTPVMLHAHHFSPFEPRAGYYSFQMPTTMSFSPRSRKKTTTMSELQEVKHIMDIFLAEVLLGRLEVENTPLHELAKSVQFQYYHSDKDQSGIILPASEIESLDQNFNMVLDAAGRATFPEFSPFLKGCVSISSSRAPHANQ